MGLRFRVEGLGLGVYWDLARGFNLSYHNKETIILYCRSLLW